MLQTILTSGKPANESVTPTADDLQKVTVHTNGTMHLTDPTRPDRTLCGRRWWFRSDHGTTYCQSCQAKLSKIYTPES